MTDQDKTVVLILGTLMKLRAEGLVGLGDAVPLLTPDGVTIYESLVAEGFRAGHDESRDCLLALYNLGEFEETDGAGT